jgi:hypothetical protein
MWDFTDDSWWADGPVILVFDNGTRLELLHNKFDDLSITWNTIDLATVLDGGDDPETRRDLRWSSASAGGHASLRGGRVESIQILRWAQAPKGLEDGSVAIGVGFSTGKLNVFNALDENGLQIGDWEPDWSAVWSS